MTTDRTEQMKKIRDEVVALKASPLYEYRTSNIKEHSCQFLLKKVTGSFGNGEK